MHKGKPFLYSVKDRAMHDLISKHISKPAALQGAIKGGKPDPDFAPPGEPKRVGGEKIYPSFH